MAEEINQVKLAIVGGRDYTNYKEFKDILRLYIKEKLMDKNPDVIISGGAKGVDTMARNYANENNIKLNEFIPEWNTKGRNAGLDRNTDIINESTHVLALPTPSSIGTYDSINKATKCKKILTVIKVK